MLADIPGLVEGASAGVGLGDRFLAHVERTLLLIYVVDGSQGPEAALEALLTVRGELRTFDEQLAARPALIALNKVDLLDAASVDEAVVALGPAAHELGGVVVPVSAAEGSGLGDLSRELDRAFAPLAVAERATASADVAPVVLRPSDDHIKDFTVERDGDVWRVHGRMLERLVAKADLTNEQAVAYLQDVMERAGLSVAIRRAGAADGDTIAVGDAEFELAPDLRD